MFKRKPKEVRERTKIEKRVEKLPTHELAGWAENTIYSITQNLNAWQKSKDSFYLKEAKLGAEALTAVVNALNERSV
jgi:hypothetical protein